MGIEKGLAFKKLEKHSSKTLTDYFCGYMLEHILDGCDSIWCVRLCSFGRESRRAFFCLSPVFSSKNAPLQTYILNNGIDSIKTCTYNHIHTIIEIDFKRVKLILNSLTMCGNQIEQYRFNPHIFFFFFFFVFRATKNVGKKKKPIRKLGEKVRRRKQYATGLPFTQQYSLLLICVVCAMKFMCYIYILYRNRKSKVAYLLHWCAPKIVEK